MKSGCLKRIIIPTLFVCGILWWMGSTLPNEQSRTRTTQTAVAALPTLAASNTPRPTRIPPSATPRPRESNTPRVTETETAVPTALVLLSAATETPKPSATFTETPKPSSTPTDEPTATMTDAPVVVGAALMERLEDEIADVPGVALVNGTRFSGSSFVTRVYVIRGMNSQTMAEAIWEIANTAINNQMTSFEVNISDPTGDVDYRWVDGEWEETQITVLATRAPTREYSNETLIPDVSPTYVVSRPVQNVVQSMSGTYYATGGINLRTCASTTCDRAGQVTAGTALTVTGQIDGEAVNSGNARWYRVRYGGGEAYVYSGLVTRNAPAAAAPPQQNQSAPSQNPPVVQPTQPQQSVNTGPQWNCGGDLYNCSDFGNRAEMMSYWNMCPGDPSRLDRDNDGVACESLR